MLQLHDCKKMLEVGPFIWHLLCNAGRHACAEGFSQQLQNCTQRTLTCDWAASAVHWCRLISDWSSAIVSLAAVSSCTSCSAAAFRSRAVSSSTCTYRGIRTDTAFNLIIIHSAELRQTASYLESKFLKCTFSGNVLSGVPFPFRQSPFDVWST